MEGILWLSMILLFVISWWLAVAVLRQETEHPASSFHDSIQ